MALEVIVPGLTPKLGTLTRSDATTDNLHTTEVFLKALSLASFTFFTQC